MLFSVNYPYFHFPGLSLFPFADANVSNTTYDYNLGHGITLSAWSFAGIKGDKDSIESFIFPYKDGSYSLLYSITSRKRVEVRWVTTERPTTQ